MEDSKRQAPFTLLGKQLRVLRENRQESLAEVSGAVEIDTEVLERIERGEERPSEDILMLLIDHFGMQDHEAVELWESAGYERGNEGKFTNYSDQPVKPTIMLLALDMRVMYSDSVHIASNQNGLVLNFTQAAGQAQPMPVARVGMSYEQADQVLKTLQSALLHRKYSSGPKGLPAPKPSMKKPRRQPKKKE